MHPAELLATVQRELIDRSGIDPAEVGQVVAGCVSQVGEQAFNIARTAWLTAGLPLTAAATTVDTQCGSSQQATNLATSLVGSGVVDVADRVRRRGDEPGADRVERVAQAGARRARPQDLLRRSYEFTSQFEGAERIADKWDITRADTDAFGLASQQRAAQAWAEGRFDTQVVAVDAPDVDEDGKPTRHHPPGRARRGPPGDEPRGARRAQAGGPRPEGVHTAGNSSADHRRRRRRAPHHRRAGGRARARAQARVVDTCLVGVDPVLMLTGPIDATQRLLARTGMSIDDIDLFEINEAFASVVLAWQRELGADPEHDQPQRRGHRARPPAGGHRRDPHDQGRPRARADRRRTRPRHDVLRRWPRHGHHHRAHLNRHAGAANRGTRPPRERPATGGTGVPGSARPRRGPHGGNRRHVHPDGPARDRPRSGVRAARARQRPGRPGRRRRHGRSSTSPAATDHRPPHRHRHARDRLASTGRSSASDPRRRPG